MTVYKTPTKLPLEIQKEFFKFFTGENSVKDFEQWLYENSELEKNLTESEYLDLISLNFNKNYTKHEVHKILDAYLNLGEFEKWKIYKILNDLISKNENFIKSLIQTYNLYCNGFYFMDNLGMNYGLNFVVYEMNSWEELTNHQKQNRIVEIYEEVKTEALKILNWIESQKIIITDEKNDYIGYEVIDNRTEEEKELKPEMVYKLIDKSFIHLLLESVRRFFKKK